MVNLATPQGDQIRWEKDSILRLRRKTDLSRLAELGAGYSEGPLSALIDHVCFRP